MRRLIALSALFAGLAAVPAAAQQPTTPAPAQPAPQQPAPQQPAPQQPAPAPAPAAKLTLASEGDKVVLARRSFRVAGRLTPAVAGQKVVVRLYRGKRKLQARSVAVDAEGGFRLRLTARRTGTVSVRASHRATPELGTAVAGPLRLDVLPRRVSGGQRGLAVRLMQRQLKRRGYVIGRAGLVDARTARAVLAFRKVSGLKRTSTADLSVMRRLADGGGFFKVRYPGHGKHIEADLSRQVFAMIRGKRVERIYHTSTGSPATPTIKGNFRFYRSQPGTNAKGMVHSQYFIRGYAIHGYPSVPVYPASHGCLRVPIADALAIFRWIRLGDRIDVYA
jgi:peptidoglycan hydrolase-like protein with peptidoglycan-binding domain